MPAHAPIPACCSMSFVYSLYNAPITNVNYLKSHFIAVIEERQKPGFDRLCKDHTLLSCSTPHMGAHGHQLTVCVFRKGKTK